MVPNCTMEKSVFSNISKNQYRQRADGPYDNIARKKIVLLRQQN